MSHSQLRQVEPLTEWKRLKYGYLTQCEYCGCLLRNTGHKIDKHHRKCKDRKESYLPERLPEPYKFECRLCYCLLLTKDQKHNCPCR